MAGRAFRIAVRPLLLIEFFVLAALCPPRMARAGLPYVELGAGISQITEGQTFFDGEVAARSPNMGTSLSLSVGWNISPTTAHTRLHIGAVHRFSSGSKDARSYALQASYPFLRLEIQNAVISVGATPLLWKRTGEATTLTSFTAATSSLALFGELGMQWPITPEVSFGLAGTWQAVRSAGGISPKQVLDGVASLRFYIGGDGNSLSPVRSRRNQDDGPYKGHRYPYGWQIDR